MEIACEAAGIVSQAVIEGLTHANLKCAITNAVRATQVGVIGGVDQQLTGKVEKIDTPLLKTLLAQGVIPLVTPILCDRDGNSLRANSDAVAAELAAELGASKLIYLTPFPGLILDGKLQVNLSLSALEKALQATSAFPRWKKRCRKRRRKSRSACAEKRSSPSARSTTARSARTFSTDARTAGCSPKFSTKSAPAP